MRHCWYFDGDCSCCRARRARKKAKDAGDVYLTAGMIASTLVPYYLFDTIPVFHRSNAHDMAAGSTLLALWMISFLWKKLEGVPYLGTSLRSIAAMAVVAFPATVFGESFYFIVSR